MTGTLISYQREFISECRIKKERKNNFFTDARIKAGASVAKFDVFSLSYISVWCYPCYVLSTYGFSDL